MHYPGGECRASALTTYSEVLKNRINRLYRVADFVGIRTIALKLMPVFAFIRVYSRFVLDIALFFLIQSKPFN